LKKSKDEFDRYLLEEYQHLADAHFRSIGAISAFFRYYLVIMALPVSLVGVFIGILPNVHVLPDLATIATSLAIVSIIISIVGYFVMLYVINLRLDVILYARAVNGIRKYFYDQGPLELSYKFRMRVLPQSPSLPPYRERSYFGPVILTFAFFNSAYLIAGSALPSLAAAQNLTLQAIPWWVWTIGILFFLGHIASYGLYARYHEFGYLKSLIVGVDIDGVLNKHRTQFSTKLRERTGKIVLPEWITTIPLHEDPLLGVSRPDENAVFNEPDYWTTMPCIDGGAKVIHKLRNQFKLKIHIFSYRAWPTSEIVEDPQLFKQWRDAAILHMAEYVPPSFETVPPSQRHPSARTILYRAVTIFRLKHGLKGFGSDPIRVITKCWLSENQIEYDKFTLEKGNEDLADPRGHFRNRFNISRNRKIRFFVEDDADKANKLAFICDIVFLLNQPYNKWKPIVDNVVRVNSWDDIAIAIKNLL
jgi:uncharacterized HAD superfamily protein